MKLLFPPRSESELFIPATASEQEKFLESAAEWEVLRDVFSAQVEKIFRQVEAEVQKRLDCSLGIIDAVRGAYVNDLLAVKEGLNGRVKNCILDDKNRVFYFEDKSLNFEIKDNGNISFVIKSPYGSLVVEVCNQSYQPGYRHAPPVERNGKYDYVKIRFSVRGKNTIELTLFEPVDPAHMTGSVLPLLFEKKRSGVSALAYREVSADGTVQLLLDQEINLPIDGRSTHVSLREVLGEIQVRYAVDSSRTATRLTSKNLPQVTKTDTELVFSFFSQRPATSFPNVAQQAGEALVPSSPEERRTVQFPLKVNIFSLLKDFLVTVESGQAPGSLR